MHRKPFDIVSLRIPIIEAAKIAGSAEVSIYTKFLTGEDDDPTFYISSELLCNCMSTKNKFYTHINKYMKDFEELCVLVEPHDKIESKFNTMLVVDGEWVYD